MISDSFGIWIPTHDGDKGAFLLYKRHYTYVDTPRRHDLSNPARHQFIGPGEKLPLVTKTYNALFGWRKHISDDGQIGVNCAIFHNESNCKASDMILAAEEWAWDKWPNERLYTYVNSEKILFRGRSPGWCFRKAGWKECGKSKIHDLIILEKLPQKE